MSKKLSKKVYQSPLNLVSQYNYRFSYSKSKSYKIYHLIQHGVEF